MVLAHKSLMMTVVVHTLKEPLCWQTLEVVSQVSVAPLVSKSGRVLCAAGFRGPISVQCRPWGWCGVWHSFQTRQECSSQRCHERFEVLCEENKHNSVEGVTMGRSRFWHQKVPKRTSSTPEQCAVRAVTGVRVHPETKQLMEVDCHFVRNRSAADMAPHILSRVSSLSVVSGAEHMTVNHSETFKDPVTGAHTNHVEGAHSLMKRESRVQFPASPV